MPCNGNWLPVNALDGVAVGVGVNVDADVVCQAVQQLATVDNRHGTTDNGRRTADIGHRTLCTAKTHPHNTVEKEADTHVTEHVVRRLADNQAAQTGLSSTESIRSRDIDTHSHTLTLTVRQTGTHP